VCPVCDGGRLVEATVAGLALRRCVSCGLRVAAFPATNTTSYGTVDAEAYAQSIGVIRKKQSASIVAIVQEHVAQGEWLDVGCGFGHAVDAARNAGYAARGIEPNAIAAQAARDRGADVEHGTLGETSREADVVSTFDVLEHLEDIHAFAQLVKRKARRLWVIKVPSSDGPYYRLAHALRIPSAIERLWQSRYEHPHRLYFNEVSLRRFLDKHGFKTVAMRYLHELSADTVVQRLTLDRSIPRWKAVLAIPVVIVISLIERIRRRSDALLILAEPRADG
jgi:2-polyprenyl-3-methyl-5-hydroxy-6-metoxy-1,4-benzoquinol methylase